MNDISPGMVAAVISGILGGIVLVLDVIKRVSETVRAARAPERAQNARMDDLDKRLTEVEARLQEGERSIHTQQEASRLSHEALLALLDHSLSGNNTAQMQAAKDKLRQHLLKGGM